MSSARRIITRQSEEIIKIRRSELSDIIALSMAHKDASFKMAGMLYGIAAGVANAIDADLDLPDMDWCVAEYVVSKYYKLNGEGK